MDLREIIARAVPQNEWYWCGYPGHLIVASNCRFHLHTRIGLVIVSTVGDYWPAGAKKREAIGTGRDFETMVFLAKDTERPEGEPLTYEEIDFCGSCDSEESEIQHHTMCKIWSCADKQRIAACAMIEAAEAGK